MAEYYLASRPRSRVVKKPCFAESRFLSSSGAFLITRFDVVRWLLTCDLIGGSIARWMKNTDYDGYRFPPAIIQQAIWLYFRFT